jgi:hypothetical protein
VGRTLRGWPGRTRSRRRFASQIRGPLSGASFRPKNRDAQCDTHYRCPLGRALFSGRKVAPPGGPRTGAGIRDAGRQKRGPLAAAVPERCPPCGRGPSSPSATSRARSTRPPGARERCGDAVPSCPVVPSPALEPCARASLPPASTHGSSSPSGPRRRCRRDRGMCLRTTVWGAPACARARVARQCKARHTRTRARQPWTPAVCADARAAACTGCSDTRLESIGRAESSTPATAATLALGGPGPRAASRPRGVRCLLPAGPGSGSRHTRPRRSSAPGSRAGRGLRSRLGSTEAGQRRHTRRVDAVSRSACVGTGTAP